MVRWRQHTPEQRLLLALLGSREGTLDRQGMLSLFRRVNWQNFLAHTSPSLHPYLAFRLESYAECIEARRELEQLFRARRHTAVRNLRLRHELGRVIEALRQSGIPALALKGIVLAYAVYPDASLRPMSDLDLLVPPAKRERALQVLQELGFEYPEIVKCINRDHLSRLAPEQEFAHGLLLPSSKILLEVHSELECSEPLLPTPVQEFWSRAVAVDLHGLTTMMLSPEDFLFHLCLHSYSHRFEFGLLPLLDLQFLIDSRRDWQWPGIASRSIRSGCAVRLYVTLSAARDLIGTPVPDSFFESCPQSAELRQLCFLVEDQICSAGNLSSGVPLFLPSLAAEPSWRSRTRMLFGRMRLVAREEIEPRLTLGGLIRRRRLAFRRLLATLRIKIPYYFRAWKAGRLRLSVVKEVSLQLRRANTLFQMVADQEASWEENKEHIGPQ